MWIKVNLCLTEDQMIKTFLAVAAVAFTAATFSGGTAEAKTNVHIGIGVGDPFYYGDCDYSLIFHNCGYYHPRYRYYRPHTFYPRYHERRYVDKLSCREVRSNLRARGYRNVESRDCNGQYYSFNATRRGQAVRVTVNAYSGSITRVRGR
jgi:hypothetical protein